MTQGSLSRECYNSLEENEIDSLTKIRAHYTNKEVFCFGTEKTLELIDLSYEAMGRTFRSRVNRKSKEFGRYKCEDFDGVFLLISDTLLSYDSARFFFHTPKEASDTYKEHKLQITKAEKILNRGIDDLYRVINGLCSTTLSKNDEQQVEYASRKLSELKDILSDQVNKLEKDKRSLTQAEFFVSSVCDSLVWQADIKPTKPTTDSQKKTPLLRFLEVFYPKEARQVLSKVYDRERKLPNTEKIGATFIPPL